MTPGRLNARRRHAMSAVQEMHHEACSLAVKLQDLSVEVEGHDAEIGDVLWEASQKTAAARRFIGRAVELLSAELTADQPSL